MQLTRLCRQNQYCIIQHVCLFHFDLVQTTQTVKLVGLAGRPQGQGNFHACFQLRKPFLTCSAARTTRRYKKARRCYPNGQYAICRLIDESYNWRQIVGICKINPHVRDVVWSTAMVPSLPRKFCALHPHDQLHHRWLLLNRGDDQCCAIKVDASDCWHLSSAHCISKDTLSQCIELIFCGVPIANAMELCDLISCASSAVRNVPSLVISSHCWQNAAVDSIKLMAMRGGEKQGEELNQCSTRHSLKGRSPRMACVFSKTEWWNAVWLNLKQYHDMHECNAIDSGLIEPESSKWNSSVQATGWINWNSKNVRMKLHPRHVHVMCRWPFNVSTLSLCDIGLSSCFTSLAAHVCWFQWNRQSTGEALPRLSVNSCCNKNETPMRK